MKTERIVIGAGEIREIYNDFFVDMSEYASDDKFEEFLRFLEIDTYDWIRENIKQYLLFKANQ